jgi:DNA (cytosine-5)-methyltransferase 1
VKKGAPAVASGYAEMLARELPREPPEGVGWRLASFFCCAGGIDLGFRSAGITPAYANDIDKDAVWAYGRNIGHAPVHADIREVALGAHDYPPADVDVVTGGFPCVTFSTAGRRLGVVDDLHGKLYLELCRVIREIRPRYFVAENVRGILSANGGQAIKLVHAAFLRLGYRTAHELVNMAEHGVPQTRERVIFVGVRADQWRGSFRFPPRTHRLAWDKKATQWLRPAVSLIEAIGDLPAPGERVVGVMHEDAAARAGREESVSSYQSSRPPRATGPSHSQKTVANVLIVRGHESNDTPAYASYNVTRKRAHGGSPAPTVTTPKQNVAWVENHAPNDAPVSPAHAMSRRVAHRGRRSPTVVSEATNVQPLIAARNPDFANPMRDARAPSPTMTAGGATEDLGGGGHLRRMTVRECARVQSFPDWFEFPESQGAGYKLVGNAVPPLYAKRLALALLEYDEREVIR